MTISHGESKADVIWKACLAIANTDPTSFGSVTRGRTSVELPEVVPIIERIVSFYGRATPGDIEVMPDNQRQVFSREISNVQSAFQSIRNLEYQDGNQAENRLREVYHSTLSQLTPFVPPDTLDAAGSKAEIQRLIQSANEAKNATEHVKEEAETVLADVRDLAKEQGVTQHAAIFRDAAKEYQEQKRPWLLAFGSLSLVAIAVAVALIVFGLGLPAGSGDLGVAIQVTAAKLFGFGILSYAILLTGRGYRAAAHNQIINQHRCNALRSFQAFVDGAADEATKNAVLVQATHSIFSHRPSGFGQQENDTMPPSHTLELTRAVVGDNKRGE